jgi:hypothetical protein
VSEGEIRFGLLGRRSLLLSASTGNDRAHDYLFLDSGRVKLLADALQLDRGVRCELGLDVFGLNAERTHVGGPEGLLLLLSGGGLRLSLELIEKIGPPFLIGLRGDVRVEASALEVALDLLLDHNGRRVEGNEDLGLRLILPPQLLFNVGTIVLQDLPSHSVSLLIGGALLVASSIAETLLLG